MEDFSKNGRKLRPRKTSGPAYSSSSYSREPRREGEHSERRNFSDRPARSYGERSERPARPYGEHSERRSFSDRPARPYAERSERRNFSDRPARPYGEHSERRSFSDRPARPYGEHSERRNFSDRPARPYGERSERPARPYGEHSERRNFSGRPARPYGGKQDRRPIRREPLWNKASEEGINRMISRKPQIDNNAYSDADTVKTPIQNEVRLNKFIANSGVCSRREADTLIQAGVVTVNGEVVTELGVKVNIYEDDIRFNGERLKGEEKVYIVMNKPAGYVTTASDPHAEKTVMDLLKGCEYRVFPVGRLDKNTTGVLMFTNDGEIAERLTHPSYDKKKIYQVLLNKPLTDEDYQKVLTGVNLSDGSVKADELEFIEADDHRKLGIEIHSGKNRVVRRIFESLGYDVKALDRVYFAGLTKKGLKKGEWRKLSEGEVNILRMGAYV